MPGIFVGFVAGTFAGTRSGVDKAFVSGFVVFTFVQGTLVFAFPRGVDLVLDLSDWIFTATFAFVIIRVDGADLFVVFVNGLFASIFSTFVSTIPSFTVWFIFYTVLFTNAGIITVIIVVFNLARLVFLKFASEFSIRFVFAGPFSIDLILIAKIVFTFADARISGNGTFLEDKFTFVLSAVVICVGPRISDMMESPFILTPTFTVIFIWVDPTLTAHFHTFILSTTVSGSPFFVDGVFFTRLWISTFASITKVFSVDLTFSID
jgi:hypothetical protein